MSSQNENIEQFKTLFRGRQDIYALRWEKDGKSGYMPAYKVDWSDYNLHKSKGGSFKNYSKKEYQTLSDEVLNRHFQGIETIGIYPLLEDNTSFFIAADFDDNHWAQVRFMYYLEQYIEVQLEENLFKYSHCWLKVGSTDS